MPMVIMTYFNITYGLLEGIRGHAGHDLMPVHSHVIGPGILQSCLYIDCIFGSFKNIGCLLDWFASQLHHHGKVKLQALKTDLQKNLNVSLHVPWNSLMGTGKRTCLEADSATYIVLMQGEVVCGQHTDPQAWSQSGVQEITNQVLILVKTQTNTEFRFQTLTKSQVTQTKQGGTVQKTIRLHLNVLTTLPEALGQHGDDIFVVVEQLLHKLAVTSLCLLVFDLTSRMKETEDTAKCMFDKIATNGSFNSLNMLPAMLTNWLITAF